MDLHKTLDPVERAARWITLGGLAACVAGVVVLFVTSLIEVTSGTAQSIEDGYWLGRLRGSAVGVDLAVVGATITVVAGTVSTWLAGGWMKRILATTGLSIAAFWWAVALLSAGSGASCPTCVPGGPDPMTFAYSLPAQTGLLLLVPALVVGLVALAPARARERASTA